MAMSALESKFVTVEGVKLHYQELGSGAPVICIHGAGPGASAESNFKLNAGPFSEKFRVVLYDMPQYGKSDKVVLTEPRLKYNARILNGFMAALGIDKAHIVGNSMGGQVAMKLGLDYPDRLTKVVIIGSTPMPPIFTPFPVEGIKMIARYYKGTGPSREKLRDLLQTILYDPSFLTDEVFEERYKASIDPETVELFGKTSGRDAAREPGRRPAQAEGQAARGLGHGRPLWRARRRASAHPDGAGCAHAHLHQVRPLGAGRARRTSSTGWCSTS